nr:MAG TPA: hypothetical protein [Caudoviricetes sp.]
MIQKTTESNNFFIDPIMGLLFCTRKIHGLL